LILGNYQKQKKEHSVEGCYLKVDKENVYFTPDRYTHYIFFYTITGKEIKKFGNERPATGNGGFCDPAGLTVNEKYLYICDKGNNRLQVLDKENGIFKKKWNGGQELFNSPQAILFYENLLYIGDSCRIQIFTKDGIFITLFGQRFGRHGFTDITGICSVNDKYYIVDSKNYRVQVWNCLS